MGSKENCWSPLPTIQLITFLTLDDDNTRILCFVYSWRAGFEFSFCVLDEAIDMWICRYTCHRWITFQENFLNVWNVCDPYSTVAPSFCFPFVGSMHKKKNIFKYNLKANIFHLGTFLTSSHYVSFKSYESRVTYEDHKLRIIIVL